MLLNGTKKTVCKPGSWKLFQLVFFSNDKAVRLTAKGVYVTITLFLCAKLPSLCSGHGWFKLSLKKDKNTRKKNTRRKCTSTYILNF